MPSEYAATTQRQTVYGGKLRGRPIGRGRGRFRSRILRTGPQSRSGYTTLNSGSAQSDTSRKVKSMFVGSLATSNSVSASIPRGYSKCELCGKVLKKVSMFQHRQVHLGIKNHECEICGKKFTQKAPLVTHRRIHTGEKPYSCYLCGKLFAAQSGMAQHTRRCKGQQIDYAVYLDSDQ